MGHGLLFASRPRLGLHSMATSIAKNSELRPVLVDSQKYLELRVTLFELLKICPNDVLHVS